MTSAGIVERCASALERSGWASTACICRTTPDGLMPRSKVSAARSRVSSGGVGYAGEPIVFQVFTERSMACSRVRSAGPSSTGNSRGSCHPTERRPVVDMIDTRESTRSRCSRASVWAIMPPIETPVTWALLDAEVVEQPDGVVGHVAQRVGQLGLTAHEPTDDIAAMTALAAQLGRATDVAVVEADHVEAALGELLAELRCPPGQRPGEAHDQQQRRIIGVAERVVAELDAGLERGELFFGSLHGRGSSFCGRGARSRALVTDQYIQRRQLAARAVRRRRCCSSPACSRRGSSAAAWRTGARW